MPIWLRVLSSRKNLGSNTLIVGLLAIGLGAAALLYSTADQLILRPVRTSDPSRLVRAGIRRSQLITREYFGYKHFEMAQQVRNFADTAADAELDVTVALFGMRPVSALAHLVSGDYFALLNATPEAGRVLGRRDAQLSSPEAAVVISDAARTKLFGGSQNAVGSTIRIQGKPFTVVGVMSKGFVGISLDSAADLWLPFSAQPSVSSRALDDPESDLSFSIFARLRNGSRLTDAAAEFDTLYESDATANKQENAGKLILEPIDKAAFSEHDQFSKALVLLLCGFMVMLAMMVVNVAAILLVRAARRARDVAIQVALGASSTQIVTAGLLEALFLGLAGGAGALLVSYFFAPALVRFLPPGRIPLSVDLDPNFRTAGLIVLAAAGLSVLFGVVPAWSASRTEPQQVLRSGTATRRLSWCTRVLIVLQSAGTLLVLVETALTLRTYDALLRSNPGFDTRNLTVFTLDAVSGDISRKVSPMLATDLAEGAKSLPGVEAVCFASAPVMQRIGLKTSVALPGRKIERRAFLNTSFNQVSEDYFSTLRIPVLAGRALSGVDAKGSNPTPVVINTALDRVLFGHEDPIGRRFGSGPPESIATPKFVVVGVVRDSKYRSLREVMPPIFYAPFQHGTSALSGFTMYVRAESPSSDVIRGVRAALFRLDPTLAFSDISTMRQMVRDSVWAERLTAALGLILSVILGLMAAAGLYGMLSYAASQRYREFGIRVAVGATSGDLAIMLTREAAKILVPGLLFGLAAHAFVTRFISPFLFGVRPLDPASIFSAVLFFGIISLVAAYAPIRKVIAVSPTVVLNDSV